MANSSPIPFSVVVIFSVFYAIVFIISVVGNTWVIINGYTILKRTHSPVMWFLANLASADLLFTFLTVLNVITFHWRWVGGDGTCKLQGFLVEATYTVSITTLVVLSYQRLKAVIDPLNARIGSGPRKEFLKIVIIWAIGLSVCSPLAHIYRMETQDTGKLVCANTKWGNIGRKIFYTLHATLFFIVPLSHMIFTQTQIHRALRSRPQTINNTFMEWRFNRRHKKVTTTLAALTTAFVICWSPFMVTRTLLYFHLASYDYIWKGSQLLIFLNAALDPLLYGYFGGNLKSALRRLLRCNYSQQQRPNVISLTDIRTNTIGKQGNIHVTEKTN